MIGQLTDKITRTEYIDIYEFFTKTMRCKKIWYYNKDARNPYYDPNNGWSKEYGYGKQYNNGGSYGKIKVQYYIPKGCRSERIRVIGLGANNQELN